MPGAGRGGLRRGAVANHDIAGLEFGPAQRPEQRARRGQLTPQVGGDEGLVILAAVEAVRDDGGGGRLCPML